MCLLLMTLAGCISNFGQPREKDKIEKEAHGVRTHVKKESCITGNPNWAISTYIRPPDAYPGGVEDLVRGAVMPVVVLPVMMFFRRTNRI